MKKLPKKTIKNSVKKASLQHGLRAEALAFLEAARQESNLSFSAISRIAKISPSTITRFIKDDSMQELSMGTLNKIAIACGFGSFKDYIFNKSSQKTQKIEISDDIKFETYEAVKKVFIAKKLNARQIEITEITNAVLDHARALNTDFITDSLIMYVLERLNK